MIDPSPAIGNNFYRIKQVDLDGTITYSTTITIYYNPSTFSVSVYPNPVKEVLNVRVNSAVTGRYTISITDMAGKKSV
ncbi:MAG: T9SS type A sorting domain-containing protein [Bacteroidota bacterium]